MSLIFKTLDGHKDLSRFERTITPVGAPVLGHRMDFGGSDYLDLATQINAILAVANDWTVKVWFKLNVIDTQGIFQSTFGGSDRMGISYRDSALRVGYYDGAFTAKSVAFTQTNVWKQIAVVNSSGVISGYLNAVPMTGVGTPGTEATVKTTIAARTSGNVGLNGSLGEVSVYDDPWTPGDFKEDYERTEIYY